MIIIYKKNHNNISNNIELKYFLLKLIKNLIKLFPFYLNFNNNYIYIYKFFYKFYNNNNYNNIYIYISYIINNKIIFNYPIYKLFFIYNNIFLLNNIKKIFINRLSNNYGLFFNTFKEKNKNYIYCIYFKNKNIIITIILNKQNKFYIKINNNITIDLITLFNIKGISNNFIYYNFKNVFNKIIIYNIINKNNKFNTNNSIELFDFYLNILSYKDLIIILKISKILLYIKYNKYNLFDIDHFNNRYIETWKNFIQESILISLDRYIFNIYKNNNYILFLTNLNKTIKENIITNPLCQILNLYNTNFNLETKINKISLIGPGSLFEKNNFNLKLKSLHLSQLGNICILDTYENFKCGLILNLPIKTFINNTGNIISELNYISHNSKRINKFYITNKNLEKIKINFSNINIKKNKIFKNKFKFISLYKGEFYINNIKTTKNYFKNFSTFFSHIINFIPFLNFNDPIRILMGSKMMGQSLKLLYNENPLVKTNVCYNNLNLQNIISITNGIIIKVNSFFIKIKTLNNTIITYYLNNLYKCKVWEGERVLLGDIIAYNTNKSDLCYGKNLLISYNYFNGYEFEDAFIVNNNLIYNYIMSSIKFNKYLIKFIKNPQKIEYSTFNLPKINYNNKININKYGIPKKNNYFNNIYIFLGKILVKNIINHKNNYFNNIFGDILKKITNKSIFLNYSNNFNKLIKINFNKLINFNYFLSINFIILSLNNLNIGDKLSGRYGNKGVISLILNKIDLPYNIKGYIPDLLINPLSVPSRMNLGQLYEGLLGFISFLINKIFIINTDKIIDYKFIKLLIYNYFNILQKFNLNSKLNFKLKNPKNGYYLLNKNIILNSYFLKLMHLSSEKINKRSIDIKNKYYTITQQPVKGTKNKGGQRFGEMELWALNAYKSIYNINEFFNDKSDNLIFRYNYIKNNLNHKKNYFSESYITLLKELFNLLISYKPINIIYKK